MYKTDDRKIIPFFKIIDQMFFFWNNFILYNYNLPRNKHREMTGVIGIFFSRSGISLITLILSWAILIVFIFIILFNYYVLKIFL